MSQEENSVACKVGQIIRRGDHRRLIRVYPCRDHETETKRSRSNDPRPHAGSASIMNEEVARMRLGRGLEGARITLNEDLDR